MPYADPENARQNARERWLRVHDTPEFKAQQRVRNKRWRERHPEAEREHCRLWRERNPGWWRKYQGTPEQKAYMRAWHEAHREERHEAMKRRYRADPSKFRAWAMAYWTRKIGAEQGPIELEAIIRRDRGVCQICRKKVALRDRSFDHIIPLSKGGAHRQDNLQLTHFVCNARRGPGRIPAQMVLPL